MLRVVTATAKFAAFQRRVGSRPLAAGLLELLWHFTASNAADGSIGRHSDEEIEAWIGWDGEPGALVAALVGTRWLEPVEGDGRLYVHDWHDHADRSVHMKLAREHKRFANGAEPKLIYLPAEERRAAQEWYAGHPAEVRRNSHDHSAGTVQGSSGQGQGQGQVLRPGDTAKKRPPAAAVREEDPLVLSFASDFRTALARIHPGIKPPSESGFERWVDASRLMLKERSEAEARALACWLFDTASSSEGASFWRGVVLSVPKFRDKFDQMAARKRQEDAKHERPNQGNGPGTSPLAEAARAELRRLRAVGGDAAG